MHFKDYKFWITLFLNCNIDIYNDIIMCLNTMICWKIVVLKTSNRWHFGSFIQKLEKDVNKYKTYWDVTCEPVIICNINNRTYGKYCDFLIKIKFTNWHIHRNFRYRRLFLWCVYRKTFAYFTINLYLFPGVI